MGLFSKPKKNAGWLAISFHDDAILAAHVIRPQGGRPSVERVAAQAAEKGAYLPALERFAREVRVAGFQCSTVLAASEYQILTVDAPNVQPEELKTAIRWRLKDMLDYHIDDATIDVLDIPVDRNASARGHSMYAVAARNQLVRERQELFAQAKIPLTVIDIPEMAQRNFSAMLEPEGRGIAMLSFDHAGGLLTVSYAGELYLSRRIDMPFSQLTTTNPDQQNACYDRITLELQRSLDHFERQYQFIGVSKLVLAPLAGAGAPLQAYLATNLYLPIEPMALDELIDLSKVPDLQQPEAQQRYFLTLGCALRHEEEAL